MIQMAATVQSTFKCSFSNSHRNWGAVNHHNKQKYTEKNCKGMHLKLYEEVSGNHIQCRLVLLTLINYNINSYYNICGLIKFSENMSLIIHSLHCTSNENYTTAAEYIQTTRAIIFIIIIKMKLPETTEHALMKDKSYSTWRYE